jgi:hypothetical protein
MNSDDIILRVETYAPLVTKGSELTANEVDLNFVNIYKDLENKAEATGVGAYDGGTTYQLTQAVTYNGRTWAYVNAVATAGVQPGTDPLYWVEIDPTILVHRRNSDTKLAEFTADEVSAAEIKAIVSKYVTFTKVFTRAEVLDFFFDVYEVVPAVASKGYQLVSAYIDVDDDGTPFTFASGEYVRLINGLGISEILTEFGDASITNTGVKRFAAPMYKSYEIVPNSALYLNSSAIITAGGAAATISITLTYELVNF